MILNGFDGILTKRSFSYIDFKRLYSQVWKQLWA